MQPVDSAHTHRHTRVTHFISSELLLMTAFLFLIHPVLIGSDGVYIFTGPISGLYIVNCMHRTIVFVGFNSFLSLFLALSVTHAG